MLARNDLIDYLLDHYGACDLDQPARNKCYWGGCAGNGWRGRACPHWRPVEGAQLDALISASAQSPAAQTPIKNKRDGQ